MLENLSLKNLTLFLLGILFLAASLFSYDTYRLITQINEVDTAFVAYKSQHAEKARLLNSLRANLGYGGMIHKFKNYIIRKNQTRFVELQRSMGAVLSILEQYRGLVNTTAEDLVLQEIQDTLHHYQLAMEKARIELKKGKSSKQVDALIKVDDHYALRGLGVLRQTIIEEYPYYQNKKHKPVLAAEIRTTLGYGGMIHSFKNYVLRGEDFYYKKTKDAIAKAGKLIALYNNTQTSLGEKTALKDLKKMLDEYESKLNIVRESIGRALSAEKIDKLVRVNNRHALLGLITLDHDNILQIQNKAHILSDKLAAINDRKVFHSYLVMALMLFLGIFLYTVFTLKIIRPIQELSVAMTELAHGNTTANFDYPDTAKTELGDMARALRIFQKNEEKRREAEEEIQHLAMSDPLTGLANRNQFDKRYRVMASLAKREKRLLAIFALDLDSFKPINDEYGHAAGDTVLKSIARSLTAVFRETDLIARMGGDEFSVILYGPENLDTVKTVAKRVIKLLSTPILVEDDLVTVGTSIGIVIREPHNQEAIEVLMKYADSALYEAKEAGRNTYRIHNEESIGKTVTLVNKEKRQTDEK